MERLHFTYYDPVPTVAPPNDDLELQLVWLCLLERRGFNLTQADFAQAWLNHIHYMWDEYGRCRWNLRRGVPVAEAGTYENPFHAGMGSPIRSEIWACLCAGKPQAAAQYAALDASLDHGPEGIAGEVFFAVLQSQVIVGLALPKALALALAHIKADTQTATAIRLVMTRQAGGLETWKCRDELLSAHDNENFTHAPLNVALTAWALVYGGGDFEKSILLAVNGGYDTDCTAATVGATLGMAWGREGIPRRWKAPIGEAVYVGQGIRQVSAPVSLSELTNRTLALMRRFRTSPIQLPDFPRPTGQVDLSRLPGTIRITPTGHMDGAAKALWWANGELPLEVARAGGAAWTWEVGNRVGQPFYLICLAKHGATLWIDDALVVECPADLPYVPAPHRCPPAARARFLPTKPRHRVRVELAGHGDASRRVATVLLTASNFHLEPWTASPLPFAPIL